MKWSVYLQTPEFLEHTRMFMVLPEYEPLVRQWCNVCDGARILDVGCGTGYFTRLLAKGGEAADVTGIDLEEPFIRFAREEAKRDSLDIHFMVGDALELPFEDASFDVVASHTFLTCVPDPQRAMDEMKRVVRPGGTIASVTAASLTHAVQAPGAYPTDCTWYFPFQILSAKLYAAYAKLNPPQNYARGVEPSQVPRFFASQGLQHVCAYPIGRMSCWSNAAVSKERKLRWLELYHRAEIDRLQAFMALPEMQESFSESDEARYRDLLEQKCSWLRAHTDENETWDWNGGVNLLLTGIRV